MVVLRRPEDRGTVGRGRHDTPAGDAGQGPGRAGRDQGGGFFFGLADLLVQVGQQLQVRGQHSARDVSVTGGQRIPGRPARGAARPAGRPEGPGAAANRMNRVTPVHGQLVT